MITNFNLQQWVLLFLPNLLSALVSSYAPMNRDWYQNDLQQSSLTPPPITFGIVWPLLYLSIGLVMAQISPKNPARYWLYLNLVFNLLWILAFNRWRNLQLSWWVILLAIFTLLVFFQTNTSQRDLNKYLIPYLIWLIFASYLSYYIQSNN